MLIPTILHGIINKQNAKIIVSDAQGLVVLFTNLVITNYTVMSIEKLTPAKAEKWFITREWANGLKLEVHKSTDILEFFHQYAKNKTYWDEAFAWLRETDPDKIAPGKYKIDGERVYASVSEGNIKNLEDTRWEAHQKYIDIQYVAIGREKIGVAPLSKAVSTEPFNTEKDIGFYQIPEPGCKYYEALPGTFFIFFPQDAHRPGIKVKGTDSVKKIVIKIKVS
jgi:biofilm protein TabA